MFSFFGGGHGGHPEGDGLSHGNAPISTATIPPVEILEAAYPVMFSQWALRPDSGGPGRQRGGLGGLYEIELLEQSADVFLFGERGLYPPQGVAGGGPAACNVFTYDSDDGRRNPTLTSKMTGLKITRGQRLRLESPGGGGYGAALERPPELVAEDVRLGYVSRRWRNATMVLPLVRQAGWTRLPPRTCARRRHERKRHCRRRCRRHLYGCVRD
jgi:N-methylhydantoinase B